MAGSNLCFVVFGEKNTLVNFMSRAPGGPEARLAAQGDLLQEGDRYGDAELLCDL